MLEFTSTPGGIKAAVEEMPRDELFSVDGVPYTIPTEFPPIVALEYGRMQLQHGSDATVAWALDLALGDAGHRAFLSVSPSREDVTKVVAIILARIQGLAAAVPDSGSADGPKARPTSVKPRARKAG